MENQTNSTKQIMLNYGLYSGIAAILISVVNYAIGNVYDPHWWVMAAGSIISIALIVLGIKKVKELNGGYLSLGEAIKTGLGIALIGGLISVIYTFIFTSFIEPDFYKNMAEVSNQKLLEKYPNFSDEQLESAQAMASKISNPTMTAAFGLMGSLFFGFIVSLISGAIMKKKNPEL